MNLMLYFADLLDMCTHADQAGELETLGHEHLVLQAEVSRLRAQVAQEAKVAQLLTRCAELMNSRQELSAMLQTVLDLAVEFTQAERGFLALTRQSQPLQVSVVHNLDGDGYEADRRFSQSIIDRVLTSGEPVITTDAQADPKVNVAQSIILQRIRSIICVPLKTQEAIIGVIYLDSRIMPGLFSHREPEILFAFAHLAGPAIENARLYAQEQANLRVISTLEAAERAMETAFSRYLAPHVVQSLMHAPHSVKLGGERALATILFADIHGFTAMSSRMEPEAVVEMLNRYLEGAVADVFAHNGLLDKFQGDGLMAVFGPPQAGPDDAAHAIAAAGALLRTVDRLSETSPHPFRISIGLATGMVVAGHIGSMQRMDYTVIGDAVNLASRLQAKAQPGTILCDEATYLAAGSPKGAKACLAGIRGRSEQMTLYLLDTASFTIS